MAAEIRIMRERCVLCMDCIDVCPQSGPSVADPVLVLGPGEDEIVVANSDGCIECYSCSDFCRAAAIVMPGSLHAAGDQPEIFPTRPRDRII